VDEPFVGAVNEEEAHVSRRPLDESVGRHVADRRHCLARVSPLVAPSGIIAARRRFSPIAALPGSP